MDASEIRWTLEPVERVDVVGVLMLDGDELLNYTLGLHSDYACQQSAFHETLTALHESNVQCDRLRTRLALVVEELRRARAENHTLAAQVRALQDLA